MVSIFSRLMFTYVSWSYWRYDLCLLLFKLRVSVSTSLYFYSTFVEILCRSWWWWNWMDRFRNFLYKSHSRLIEFLIVAYSEQCLQRYCTKSSLSKQYNMFDIVPFCSCSSQSENHEISLRRGLLLLRHPLGYECYPYAPHAHHPLKSNGLIL